MEPLDCGFWPPAVFKSLGTAGEHPQKCPPITREPAENADLGNPMADVDFYKLQRPVQDRFADATRAIGVPAPLLRAPPTDRAAVYWLAAASASAAALAVVAATGFADLNSSIAMAPPAMIALYAAVAAVTVFCALKGLGRLTIARRRPYSPGLYLFPVGVIDARREPFHVFRLPELRGLDVVEPGHLRISFEKGHSYTFPVGDRSRAEAVKEELRQVQPLYERALNAEGRRELAQLDPLVDSGFSSPFSPKLPLVRKAPAWYKLAPLYALLGGALLGAAIWWARNAASEQRLYTKAKTENTVSAYRAYLARGGPRSEVRHVLLPRAQLRQAMKAGGVPAIERFMASHPTTRIGNEVSAALQSELNAEFEQAKKARSVAALRELEKRRKRYDYIKPLIQREIQALYNTAYEGYLKVASEDEQARAFMRRLLTYAERHGPRVEIRFVRRETESFETADQLARGSAFYMGTQSIPSQYFKGDYAEAQESRSGATLLPALQKPFATEILAFEIKPPMTKLEGPLPQSKVPTLYIERIPNLSGGYMTPKPRGVFVGLAMHFDATFMIPGEEPLKFKWQTWKGPNPMLLRKDGKTVADVYEEMIRPSYDRFTRLFLKLLFSNAP